MTEFHYLFAFFLGFLWIIVSRYVAVRPHPIILRDRTRLSLYYVDDSFLCLNIVRTLFITDVLLVCVRVTSGSNAYYEVFGRIVHWVYIVSGFLFVHVAAYVIFIYAARGIFQRELNAVAEVINNYESLILPHTSMRPRQWAHYNRRLGSCRLYLLRTVWIGVALFIFLSTFMCYMKLL